MGFFSSKDDDHQEEQVAYAEAPTNDYDPQAQAEAAQAQPNIDGVIPPAGSPVAAMPQPAPTPAATSNTTVDDSGTDYIMSDPAPSAQDNPAFSPTVGAPWPSNEQSEQSEPEPTLQAEAHATEPSGEVTEPEELLLAETESPHDEPENTSESSPDGTPAEPIAVTINPSDGQELDVIKQRALRELSPLIGHLNQTPEERFNTTMMMLQATDDKSLIKQAYEAAEAISDEKAKAQALLDIVNEINYFSKA